MPAKFKVEIAESAEKDLEEIWTYITQESPQAASLFVLELERQAHTLETFPKRCSLIPENEFLGGSYRHLLVGKYRVIFRIAGKRVFVLRIVHGSRLLDFSELAFQNFFAGYSEQDSIYDSL